MLGAYPIATRPLATLKSGNVVESEMSTTLSATVAAAGAAIIGSDLSAGAALSASFDSETLTIVESDLSASAALSASFDGLARQMSSADASVTLTLTPSFDSAFSTVIGSTWSVSIDPAIGPVSGNPTVAAPGSGYLTGMTLSLNGGDNNATVSILANAGMVTAANLVNAGTGYSPGTYTTTRLTGATGTGCQLTVNAVSDIYHLFVSGATKGSALSSPQTLTASWASLTFAGVDMTSTLALVCDGVSGATAGVDMTTSDTATVAWDGLAIGPVPVDWTVVLQLVTSWSGQRLKSTIKESVNVGRTLTETVNVGRSVTESVKVGE